MNRILLTAAVLALALPAAAADYRAPRTPWGAPSLDGAWTNRSLTSLQRPDEFKTLIPTAAEVAKFEKDYRDRPPKDPEDTVGGLESEWWELDTPLARIRGQPRSSWIVYPADGKEPITAEAKARRKAVRERRKVDFDNPESRGLGERCLETGTSPPLQNGGYNDNFLFVQTPDRLLIYAEWMQDIREVRLAEGARHPDSGVRRWSGDSIGWWEGDTLVVETTNFVAEEVQDPANPRADKRVIERFTRTGKDEITYGFTVTNPALYTLSWSGEMVFRPLAGRIYEFACHEGNYGLTNILAGGRAADREATAAPSTGKAP